MRPSILWLLTLTIGVPQVRAAQTERLQVGGEWCFIKTLAAAFDFRPAHGCPGEPEGDEAFRRATGPHDPLRRMRQMDGPAVARALSATRWMALYDRGDPKVIPEENVLPFVGLLESARVGVLLRSQKQDSHDPRHLLLSHRHEIARFL